MGYARFHLFCVITFLAITNTRVSAKNLVVATYNLWNVMFQWDSRKYYIAEMIRQANPDIIGFQEARADANGKRNQLKQLQTLLPEYKYHVFHSTRTLKNKFGPHAIRGWEQEGLGILSKNSIVMSHHIPLSKAVESDPNPRELLHVQIEYEHHEIFFMVVHFSTSKKLQCQNAMRVINFVASTGTDRTVIAGDFNAYQDYEWPIQAVLNGFFLPNGCPKPPGFEPIGSDQGYGFDDSWLMTNRDKQGGLTFSNMPTPGLINRPDRILVSRVGLDPVKTRLFGQGKSYADNYSFRNYVSRFTTICHMARRRWNNQKINYSCHLDCGPHGSCRCGVCAGGGDELNCDLHNCTECTAAHYNIIIFLYYFLIMYTVCAVYLIFCIFAKNFHIRTPRKLILMPRWFGYQHFVAYLMVGVATFYTLVKVGLSDIITLTLNRIPEEMFPSDHLMVVSEIKVTYH